MNKTININLDGRVFQIEEDAYEKLKKYLDTIKSRLSRNEEAQEILDDIEARIAELFIYKSGQDIIRLSLVEEIIETIGEPSDIVDEEDAEEPRKESEQQYSAPPPYYTRKGLYRSREDRVFGGVCGGLGAYFDIDPVVFRIIAVVTTLLSVGAVPIVYIVLWIAMPEARTIEQRLRMRGGVTFKDVSDNIKNEYNSVSDKFKTYTKSQNYRNMQNRMNKTGDAMANGLNAVLRVLGTILGIAIVLWSVLSIMVLTGVLVLKDSMPGLASSVGNFYITNVPDYFLSHLDLTLFNIAAGLLIGIPFLIILYLGLKLIFQFKSNGKIIGMTALGLWLAGLVLLFFTALRVVKGFEDEGTMSETHQLMDTSAEAIYLKVGNDSKPFGNKEYLLEINNLELSSLDGKLIIEGDPRINLTRGDKFEITITKKARGINEEEAEFNANSTEYYWAQNDSIIYLDRTYMLGDEALARKQEVVVNIEIPHNKKLEVSPYLDRLINYNDDSNNY
ncbi:PspC domain-containing protein [Carboxylicivirga caseinilyticus]|uniref:PspC domain-containing protein n=1 Tax=Carboxylicivirga caseinilyticus TaxID=3417572 RepID=UPI003D3383AB|nr:PspC domain-containing protein [Marinilabiliaceae bacterium A049]